ncbi:MAG TPA: hypothetical protein PK306_05030 [Aquabacterium sp.]|nr:hypothetical protein [Aquabacterium sp.]
MPAPVHREAQTPALPRRQLLGLGAAALAAAWLPTGANAADGWNAGDLLHLTPTASHDRLLIKASVRRPLAQPPRLLVDGRTGSAVVGVMTDRLGRFWRFDARGLAAGTRHLLRIVDADGQALCDAWPLATLPAPDAAPEHLRLLAYTCAGGNDGMPIGGRSTWLAMAARRRLLARGLGFAPHAVIANGDHIDWDQKTLDNKRVPRERIAAARAAFGGELDLTLPMDHPRNAAIHQAVCDHQIAGLYGTALRSTPAWFLTDDHDMFENDEFDDQIATLPADDDGRVGAELTQRLSYPEFLPDANRPAWLPGSGIPGLAEGTNGCFGTLRDGRLLEAVLYDCRRDLDNKGRHARVVPRWVEDWLLARTRADNTAQFMHEPSLPFGYSSGKLGDWYPDRLDERQGKLVLDQAKDGWQSGWQAQDQRLLAALGDQPRRAGLIVQGDFHASAAGRIQRSMDLQLRQPVHTPMTGTLGTGDLGFPSAFRRVESMPSATVTMDEALRPTEKNGFTMIDVTAQSITCRLFTWRPPQPLEDIDTMAPTLVYEIPRPRSA